MKERLTGAIILVALFVLLVPDLLTGPVRGISASGTAAGARGSPATVAGGASGTSEPSLRTYTLALTTAAPARPRGTRPGAVGSQPATAAPLPQSPTPAEVKPAAAAASRAATVMPEARSASAAAPRRKARASRPAARRWLVQLGAFRYRADAERLAAGVRRQGFATSIAPLRIGPRLLWCVRSAAQSDRAAAARLAGRLRALGHRGELLPIR